MSKFRNKIFKFLTGLDIKDISTCNNNNSMVLGNNNGLEEVYLFDFKNYQSQYYFSNEVQTPIGISNSQTTPGKIRIKPIDVLHELETIPNPFSLNLIDEKISMLKEKSKLIVQYYAKREVEGLIERLENRKQYLKYKEFFDSFQNTTDEKIEVILDKYELVMKPSDIFVPEFPDEAIKSMSIYTEKLQELCGKKPIFYVIAEADKFQEKYKQRDPILLVQSPFGFYWQILGAWDKEMLLLSEF